MRPAPTLILLLLCALAAGPAVAQVSVDSHALDSLGGGTRAPAPAAPAPAAGGAARPASHAASREHHPPERTTRHGESHEPAHPTGRPAPARLVPPIRPGTPPVIHAAPPMAAALPPVVVAPPAHPAAPPPPIPVVADAPGVAGPLPGGGTRVTFGPDRADLNPATAAAVRAVGEAMKDDPDATLDVIARATGMPDDPSTPRRLSLARALAARAVLLGAGVPSTHIFVRALGSTAPDDGPTDRVDVARTTAPAKSPLGMASGPAGGTTTAPATGGTTTPPATGAAGGTAATARAATAPRVARP